MTIIPMRDLKDTVEIERRCAEANGPVFVTKNGYGRLVVMDIEYYEKTLGKMYEAKMVNEGLSDLGNGRVTDGDEVKARIIKNYGINPLILSCAKDNIGSAKTIQNNGGKYVQEIVDGGEIVNIYHIKL